MIDWAQVRQLEEDIGADDFAEVVDVFIEEVDEAVDALRDIATLANKELESALHFLKGSAYNLGFADFGALCSKGEQSARAGQGDTVSLPDVISLYDKSKAAFLSGAAKHTSYSV